MKKIIILLFAGIISANCVLAGCSSATNSKTESSSYQAKYADNEFYSESVKKMEEKIGLSDKEADEAFGVLQKCGLITDKINYIYDNVDSKTGKKISYRFWVELNEFYVFFDDNNTITKITDGFDNLIYENGEIVATTENASTTAPIEAASTEKPTEKETDEVQPINIVDYSSNVEAGSNAFVTIQGVPDTKYYIHVYYKSGESTAEGLEPKTSDANGVVTWEWEIGTNTTPGTYQISVSDGKISQSIDFTVD